MAVTPQDDSEFNAVEDGEFEETVTEGAAPEGEGEADPADEGTDTGDSGDEGSTENRVRLNTDEVGDHYVTVKVDGQEVEMTLKEALSGVMRQQDYTRKTQEVAAERERLASFARLAEALEEDPVGTIKVLQRALGVDGAADLVEQVEEELDPTEARLRRVEAIAEREEQEARNREHIRTAETAIASTEGLESDAGELLQFAIENNVLDLNKAAHFLLLEKRAAAKVEQKKTDGEEAKNRKRAAAVVDGGRTRAPSTTVPAKPVKMTLRQAYEAAKLSQSTT